MRVTVITAVFNGEDTIADTLRSVAEQDYPDVEHVVIDGASTDATLRIVQEQGGHVAKLRSEPDNGIYSAMNKGIHEATGDIIGFLNADDTFADARVLSDMVRSLQSTGADAVFGDLLYVDRRRPDVVVRRWRSGPFDRSRLRYGWMTAHPTFYVRKARLMELGTFDERFRIAADYELMLRYLSYPGARAAYVPRVLVHMRVGGVSNRSWRAIVRKSKEDLVALRKNRIGGLFTLLLKNVRKLPQFFGG